jgi:hypothetical protein
MLEKACVQQADAYFRQIQTDIDVQGASPVPVADLVITGAPPAASKAGTARTSE